MSGVAFEAECPVCEEVHELVLTTYREIEYTERPPCEHDMDDAITRAAEEAPEDAWLDAGCARYHGRV